MIAIIYKFELKENQAHNFIEAWKEMTKLIYTHENGLGSRLHKKDEFTYIAYAQWPDKETWDHSGGNLPLRAQGVREKMRGACHKVTVLHELEVVEDLLKTD